MARETKTSVIISGMSKEKEIDSGMTGAAPDKMIPASIETFGMPQWEYLVIVRGELADLSQYGIEGWELISAAAHAFNETTYYFKRRKR